MSIEKANDPQAFANFEHDGWESVSKGYEQHFSDLTIQSVSALLEAAEVSHGKKILDVCCGPGMITAAAIARGAQATGIDFSATAIDIASANVPDAEFYKADAQSLPFADNTFDSVVCGFGIIHIADPEKALAEMFRVLRPAGRLAVSVWEPLNPNNGFGLLFGAIKESENMGNDLPHGPDFFQFSEPFKLTSALAKIGFNEPSVDTVTQTWEFKESRGLFMSFMEGGVRARALIAAQTEIVQTSISKSVAEGMEAYRASDGIYRVPMPALIGSAFK